METRTRIVLFVAVFLVLGQLLQAQSAGVVRGRVVDRSGASAVRVKVSVGMKWGLTDATGRFVLVDVPFGRHQITLERGGKAVNVRVVDVKGRLTEINDLKWPF